MACAACHDECRMDAGPSRRGSQDMERENTTSTRSSKQPRGLRRRKRPRRVLFLPLLPTTTLLSSLFVAFASVSVSASAVADEKRLPRRSDEGAMRAAGSAVPVNANRALSDMMMQRERRLARRAVDAAEEEPAVEAAFTVNVSPPVTCSPLNITFDPRGGTPPYTVFIAATNWYPFAVQLPATYADANLGAWLYQYDMPQYNTESALAESPTPQILVVVGDSTGARLNSSILQTTKQVSTSCAPINGSLDFSFATNPTQTTCTPMNVTIYTDSPVPGVLPDFVGPKGNNVQMYIMPEQQPPIVVPFPWNNGTTRSLLWNMVLTPGTNFLMTLTDDDTGGGVSGVNLVAGSEYVSTSCLASVSRTAGLPTATAVYAQRMPDFTTSIASLTTSNGVVSTATAVQTVRHGSVIQAEDFSVGKIVGIAVGIAVVAGVLAAVASWCFWRRRRGGLRSGRMTRWDVPKSAQSHLDDGDMMTMPVDRNLLKYHSRSAANAASASSQGRPNSFHHQHQQSSTFYTSSDSEGSSQSQSQSQSQNQNGGQRMMGTVAPALLRGSQMSDRTSMHDSSGNGTFSSTNSGLQQQGMAGPRSFLDQSPPHASSYYYENTATPPSRPAAHYGPGQMSTSTSSSSSNSGMLPLGGTGAGATSHERNQSSNSPSTYRSPFQTPPGFGTSSADGPGSSPTESLPLVDSSRFINNNNNNRISSYGGGRMYPAMGSSSESQPMMRGSGSQSGASAASSPPTPRGGGNIGGGGDGSGTGSGTGSLRPRQYFVQHSDAGLLLDDSLDNEDDELDGESTAELPPRYDTIQRSESEMQRQARRQQARSASGLASSSTTAAPSSTTTTATTAAAAAPQASTSAAPTTGGTTDSVELLNNDENGGTYGLGDFDEEEFWRNPSSST